MTALLFVITDKANWTGGPIINFRRLLPKLSLKGYTVHAAILYRGDYANGRYLDQQGIKIYAKPTKGILEEDVPYIYELARRIQPDVYIADTNLAGAIAGRWIKAAGIPTILLNRSNDAYNWGITKIFALGPEVWRVTALVCVSEFIRQKVAQTAPASLLLHAIPSGVPVGDYPIPGEHPGLRLVYAGRLERKQKKIIKTVEAFLELAERWPDMQFTIIGEGGEQNQIKKMIAQRGKESQFRLTGRLIGADYKEELAQHDLIILLSDYEGMPGSLMDGMSCGLVPVCTPLEGIEQLIESGQNGFIVQDREEAFFTAVRYLYQQPEHRKAMSIKAYEQVRDQFSLQRSVQLWQALIQQLTQNQQAIQFPTSTPSYTYPIPNLGTLSSYKRTPLPWKLLRWAYTALLRVRR